MLDVEFKIKLRYWSSTDYAYLINNSLGWVSDDEKYYVFDNEDDKLKMEQYLEIDRLKKYEQLVRFISNDYYELSYDKIVWQRDDWKKRAMKLIDEDLKWQQE
ncbi:hypothetical protein UFOVP787_11 [uncultured Caudovirales phage]|uniref:Uncharacterized protein n=1 Tax=uncultured Caudovirales phage TaxID=2100421 RepID=A0A6J5NSP3_9CAUD|nr:hypothetical protein UFOVP787_11 [uncultured Caudovirales phage]